MYIIEELKELSKNELLEIAKQNNLQRYKGKKTLTKIELIDLIGGFLQKSKKQSYIDNLTTGSLVAFKTLGKPKTAKVLKKSTKNKKAKVITEYGAEFIIDFDDILWVRTGTRWPKWVYELLKGKNKNVKNQ